MIRQAKQKGFTLMELLVVISIISLLSSVILASVNDAREKAEYTKLYQDIKQIETALNLARNDYNDWPPETADYWGSKLTDIWNNSQNNFSSYLSIIPESPLKKYPNLTYEYDNDISSNEGEGTYTEDGCADSPNTSNDYAKGLNIVIRDNKYVAADITLFNNLNKKFDPSEDISDFENSAKCGKIRTKGNGQTTGIIYSLEL
jgi:prepilin-type N-terminal cleavage/methylation domain-containing protein